MLREQYVVMRGGGGVQLFVSNTGWPGTNKEVQNALKFFTCAPKHHCSPLYGQNAFIDSQSRHMDLLRHFVLIFEHVFSVVAKLKFMLDKPCQLNFFVMFFLQDILGVDYTATVKEITKRYVWGLGLVRRIITSPVHLGIFCMSAVTLFHLPVDPDCTSSGVPLHRTQRCVWVPHQNKFVGGSISISSNGGAALSKIHPV